MDIEKELLKGHSKVITDRVVRFVGKDKRRFRALINLFIEGTRLVSQRAATPLSYCVMNHPALLKDHYKPVLAMLDKAGIHDGVKRNIVRLLQFVDIPVRYQGNVIDHCFRLMEPQEPIAVRVFAMTVIANLSKHHPDLKTELKLIIEDQLPFATAAYLSRAKKILRQLETEF